MRRGFYLFLVGIDVCIWLMIAGILLALTLSGAHAQILNQGGDWYVSLKLTIEGQTVELFSADHFATKKDCESWMSTDEVSKEVEAAMIEAQAVDTEATALKSCVKKGLRS